MDEEKDMRWDDVVSRSEQTKMQYAMQCYAKYYDHSAHCGDGFLSESRTYRVLDLSGYGGYRVFDTVL